MDRTGDSYLHTEADRERVPAVELVAAGLSDALSAPGDDDVAVGEAAVELPLSAVHPAVGLVLVGPAQSSQSQPPDHNHLPSEHLRVKVLCHHGESDIIMVGYIGTNPQTIPRSVG